MKMAFERDCAGIIATLKIEVLPHLSDEIARGRLFSAIYLLSEMALKLGASLEDTLSTVRRQDALFAEIAAVAAAARLRPPPPPDRTAGPPHDATAAHLAREAGGRQVCRLLDWCWTAPADPAIGKIHELLRTEMRHRIEEERKLTPRPMLNQITGG